MELIDKDTAVAEIEKTINKPYPKHDQQCDWEDGYCSGLYKALSIIEDALEVKRVDLDKEFDSFAYTLPRSATGYGPFDKHFDDPKIIEARNHGWRHSWSYKEALKIAKHFFELGLKAQKDLTV